MTGVDAERARATARRILRPRTHVWGEAEKHLARWALELDARVRELEESLTMAYELHRMHDVAHGLRSEALARAERAEERAQELAHEMEACLGAERHENRGLREQLDAVSARAERAEARRMAAEGAKREWDRMKAEVTRFREALEYIDQQLERTKRHRWSRRTGGVAPATDTSMFAGAGPTIISKLGRHVRAALQGAREEPGRLSDKARKARRPPPPEALVGALQDTVHEDTGRTRVVYVGAREEPSDGD